MALIRQAAFPEDTKEVLAIWREFIANAPVNLDFQGNEAEFKALSDKYAPPGGSVLLAEGKGAVIGCIAFRRVDDEICEMKRLYVRPVARGSDLGRALVTKLMEAARNAGYREMRLDVLEKFRTARKLYAELGFVDADPVSFNPTPGTAFLGLRL